MSVFDFNQRAWDRLVESGNRWTVPVSSQAIAKARDGDWQLVLTPSLPVPSSWFPSLTGCRVLCLASGGGQQGPILAAAGANVTVFDASEKQLSQDRLVAHRDGLSLETIQGDMADLSCFEGSVFDFIFHPCSNCFAEDIRPVWREAYRVLRPGGSILPSRCRNLRFRRCNVVTVSQTLFNLVQPNKCCHVRNFSSVKPH
jgi:SAM-dependent methyltransferase